MPRPPDETSRPPHHRRLLGHGPGTRPPATPPTPPDRAAWPPPGEPDEPDEPRGPGEPQEGPQEPQAGPEEPYAGPEGAGEALGAPVGAEDAAEAVEELVRSEGADDAVAGPVAALDALVRPEGAEAAPVRPEGAQRASVPPEAAEDAAAEGPAAAPDTPVRREGAVHAPVHPEAAEPAPAVPPEAAPDAPEPSPGDGRFTVRLDNFEGPFDLLLQLIARHRLDVTEVALSKVTDEFMAHIRAMGPDWDLDQTTEFLVVAATLLDLKAARLLPAAEVEDEADLALLEARDLLFARLLQYRAYKKIAEILAGRWEGEGRRYPRTVGLEPHHAELLPEVVISIGAERFAALAVKAMRPKAEPTVYVDHIHAPLVSVREQAGVVVALLRERGVLSFRELVAGAEDTLTVVARFLALLELYREKAVALDQETALGDLTVSWTGGGTDPAGAVTDEFDQEARPDPAHQEAAR
ncbi:ScpA family protein [Streptomyces sp. NPDC048659]|uniref:segregation and condensation protein A n=1 Tax=Streptomyces sp. NPDC048659 TaxID=3155489 RepID=UPI00343B0FC1